MYYKVGDHYTTDCGCVIRITSLEPYNYDDSIRVAFRLVKDDNNFLTTRDKWTSEDAYRNKLHDNFKKCNYINTPLWKLLEGE